MTPMIRASAVWHARRAHTQSIPCTHLLPDVRVEGVVHDCATRCARRAPGNKQTGHARADSTRSRGTTLYLWEWKIVVSQFIIKDRLYTDSVKWKTEPVSLRCIMKYQCWWHPFSMCRSQNPEKTHLNMYSIAYRHRRWCRRLNQKIRCQVFLLSSAKRLLFKVNIQKQIWFFGKKVNLSFSKIFYYNFLKFLLAFRTRLIFSRKGTSIVCR